MPATLADRSVGLHIVNAVCAALYRREKSGIGQRVDVPMFESLLQTVMGEHMGGYTYLPQRGEPGYARMLAKERRPYETKDGYVCVLVYNDKQWRAFFELIGRPELLADPRYATPEARSRDFEGAYALVAAEMKKRSTADWIAALEGADIPVQRMNSLDRHRRRPAPRGDRLLPRSRASERGPHPLDGRALGMVRIGARVPAPRAAPGRAHARGAARGGTHRPGDRGHAQQRRGTCRSLSGAARV